MDSRLNVLHQCKFMKLTPNCGDKDYPYVLGNTYFLGNIHCIGVKSHDVYNFPSCSSKEKMYIYMHRENANYKTREYNNNRQIWVKDM